MSDTRHPDQTELPSNPDTVIVGGGLAGLTAAALLARAGKTVIVHEKRSHVGGQARSTHKDGFTFNQGAHALYRGGAAERVLTDLGIAIRGGVPPVKGRIVFDGTAHIAPAGAPTLLRTKALGARDKIEIAKQLARLPKLHPGDFASITIDEWIADAVVGERPAEMLHSLVRLATYTNDHDQASADMAIGQLQAVLDTGVLYLDGGWQTLVDQLRQMPGVHIARGDGLDQLPDARTVIVATGNPQSAGALLGSTFDVGPPATASCLDLGLARKPDHDVVIGGDVPFYFSNQSAVADMAPAGRFHAAALQYLSEGDDPDPHALHTFAAQAGVRDDDIVTSRRLHRMVAVTAQSTASRGGLAGRPAATDTGHDNVFVAGDWVGPIGHLADASLASAEAAATAAMAVLDRRVVAHRNRIAG